MRLPGIVSTAFVLAASAGSAAASGNVRLENGLWFDGERFVPETVRVADGRLVRGEHVVERPGKTVDLRGLFVVPPLADAHTHGIADAPEPAREAIALVRSGILFAKNPNSTPGGVARGRAAVAALDPPALRMTFSGAGITSPGGHPSQIYRSFGADEGWHPVAGAADLERIWPDVLAPAPDFVKVYLETSEEHLARAGDDAFTGRRGLDPALVPAVVERTRTAGLSVSAHVTTAADFRTAVAAGVEEINHLPLDPLEPGDARACAERGVRVVTTVRSHRPAGGREDLEGVHRANLALLREAGVEIALGTDNGEIDVVDELIAVAALGVFPPAELLRIATTGSIRAVDPAWDGTEATFLVLRENPLEDPRAVRAIEARWVRGEPVEVPAAPAEKASVGQALADLLHGGGDVAKLVATYRQWKRDRAADFDFSEGQLNALGYAMLRHGRAADAAEILALNATEFPHSPNAWDSLAEAQAAAGDAAGAAASSRRVLELLGRVHDVDPDFRAQLERTARERIAAGS